MHLNTEAWALRTKLFNLIGDFKIAQGKARFGGHDEAASQFDGPACRLAEVYDNLPDIFTDAARDRKDQEFNVIV